jgi:hypothetical protein
MTKYTTEYIQTRDREIAGDRNWPLRTREGGVSSVQNHWKIFSVLEYFSIALIKFQYDKVHYKVHPNT